MSGMQETIRELYRRGYRVTEDGRFINPNGVGMEEAGELTPAIGFAYAGSEEYEDDAEEFEDDEE